MDSDEKFQLFGEAVEQALEERRRAGVPISRGDGRYDLPDGTMVDHDPWHGQTVAPEGWYERYGIAEEDRPPLKKYRHPG